MFFGLRQLLHAAERVGAVVSPRDVETLTEALLSFWIAYPCRDEWPASLRAHAEEVRRLITTGTTIAGAAEALDEVAFAALQVRFRAIAAEARRLLADWPASGPSAGAS